MSLRRVAVTGLGVLCPVGNNAESAWRALLSGDSGIGALTRFDAGEFSVRIAGELKNFDVGEYLSAKESRHLDMFISYGMAAGIQAVTDAGLTDSESDSHRIGIAVGSGIGGLQTIENVAEKYRLQGPRRISPFFISSTIINMVSGGLSIHYHYTGPNVSMVSACTTGAHNIGFAYRMIVGGDADVMVCGGAEAAITPLSLGSFASARALTASFNDTPVEASRPFDARRDGFVLGEGAGVLVLEDYERARRRGAKIYAEMIGFGMSADAHHITAPLEDGAGARRCIENALQDAKLPTDELHYINAHGTSTPLGDVAETLAICGALGEAAQSVMVSSTKSMTGHLLGAAGGVEAVFSVLALRDQTAPPTINLHNPDPKCNLDYVPNTARRQKIGAALSNSFGFGGTNATLVFRRA